MAGFPESMSDARDFFRTLAPGQVCRIVVLDVSSGGTELVHESAQTLFEAPNWAPDGDLILNGAGLLWRLTPTPGAQPVHIPIEGIPALNNDHVLAPDGETIYLSANDWQIYAAPLSGGAAHVVTSPDDGRMHFLHGISPDGSTLAYIGLEPEGEHWMVPGNVYEIGVDGTPGRQLTAGDSPTDGSEYSPDGVWVYVNTEAFSSIDGHAQIGRMPAAGGLLEQLSFDDRVNWFPHLSPDGRHCVYLSYPSGTVGHPPDLPVELRLVTDDDWSAPRTVVELFGGQGTINVNSWSPDGSRLAFVEYSEP